MNGYFIIGVAAFCFMAGIVVGIQGMRWHDGYVQTNAAITVEQHAQTGQGKIIKFNQDYNKAKSNVKDKCMSASLPANISSLLH